MTVAWTSESLGRRGLWYALAALMALAPLTGFAQVRPDRAARPIGDGGGGGGGGGGDTDPPGLDCLSDTSGTISLTPQTVIFGQSTTLRWSVHTPAGCGGVTVKINGLTKSHSGNSVEQPLQTTSYGLRAYFGGGSKDLARVTATIDFPRDPGGRPLVTITANNQTWAFLKGLELENAIVVVQPHVELDLSAYFDLNINNGVQIFGGRSSTQLGARLFTTDSPGVLFRLRSGWGNNVRISGLRIDGGKHDVVPDLFWIPLSTGIQLDGQVNVEIDNNEIYGWSKIGIRVFDEAGRIDRASNPMTVRIHDNYIHNNQHERSEGYGVAVQDGAYALIEKNVFDKNRHAIEGDGSDGSGYLAYRNLVLAGGGVNEETPLGTIHTHMFDMHGQEDCWGYDAYCGRAGEFMDIRYNSFFYTNGDAFKLRGTPSIGAHVISNVFAHNDLIDSTFGSGALDQTESGLYAKDNLLGVNESGNLGWCDFDGDGQADRFLATGRTWWFKSGATGHWFYLSDSASRLADVTLGDLDGDHRCDVTANGIVSMGGRGPSVQRQAELLWRNSGNSLLVWRMNGGAVEFEPYPFYVQPGLALRAIGDFSGDGQDDLFLQDGSGQVQIWEMVRGIRVATRIPMGGPLDFTWSVQATGDFDGDRITDVLWRRWTGRLAIWFRGQSASETDSAAPPLVVPSWRNVPGGVVSVDWQVKGVGDFNGDGRSDILWRHANGQVAIWFMAGGLFLGESYPGGQDPSGTWSIQQVADFDANGRSDILWRATNGQLAIWFDGDANAGASPSFQNSGSITDLGWQILTAADFNFDGRADIYWRHTSGQTAIWFMAGARFLGDVASRPAPDTLRFDGVLRDAR